MEEDFHTPKLVDITYNMLKLLILYRFQSHLKIFSKTTKISRNSANKLKTNKIKAQNLHAKTIHLDIQAKHQYQSF